MAIPFTPLDIHIEIRNVIKSKDKNAKHIFDLAATNGHFELVHWFNSEGFHNYYGNNDVTTSSFSS